ncbi:hypothetical protein TEA_022563 [Camellia sinensis var. sinensis]|uniref:Major facilitator superfamily (MFS) profile domain-containing protein n=1 Tax=Camellia sinensis var. sinensis TaxID=542762 RepID=A0A4S4EYV4_CAMSN|nr:hypothetical protein TEA_022563 [Camellia sinensis var. sinensis]
MADRKPQNNGFPGKTQTHIPTLDPPQKPKRNKYAFACAILASMTSILLGYVLMGIINLHSLLGSAAAIGRTSDWGSAAAIGRTSDWVGRQYTIVIAAAIFFAGAILMGFATNYAFLIVGHFVTGIGVGYALLIAPVCTAEVSPAASRGFLTSFPEVFINAGLLLGYVSNYAFSKLSLHLGWRFMLGLGAIPSVFLALGVLAMSESPRWLILQGRLGDTKRVLDKTSDSKEEAQLRLADIKEATGISEDCNNDVVPVPKRSQGEGVWKELILLPTPTVLYILIAGVGIHFFQQASGIDAVVLYNPKIFEKVGITSKSDKLLATVAVGFTKTILILVATFLLDRVGRRPLLLSSVGGMILSLASLEEESGVGSCFGNHDGVIVRRNILDWDGGHRMGLQLGDFSIKVAGTRDQHESRSPP